MSIRQTRWGGPVIAFFLFLSSSLAFAGEERSLRAMEDWIGLSFAETFERFGPPSAIYPLRGSEPWQDDVVFAYAEFELFFFEDHVWQIRFFNLGEIPRSASEEVVRTLLGVPLIEHEETWVYQRGGKAWPLRLRVDFSQRGDGGRLLKTFYLYRADF